MARAKNTHCATQQQDKPLEQIMKMIEPHREWLENMGFSPDNEPFTCEWLVYNATKDD